MSYPVSQVKAALTISKYSLLAMLKSPTSVVFSLLFPIIFIVVFGAMIGDHIPVMNVAVAAGSDTSGIVFKTLKKTSSISFKRGLPATAQSDALRKGRLTAILYIIVDSSVAPMQHYTIRLQAAGSGNLELLEMIINETIEKINQRSFPHNASIATLSVTKIQGRTYRSIDFILPGQLGFSLLMAGIYGSSFLLFNLRQNLVLKRLRTTPVKRRSIIAGEMLSRLFFHVISFIAMVALGYFAFQFTLINGLATFAEMLVFSLLGLVIFMNIGFIISGFVQNENAISPIANTIVLPQILLCGLFFPIENYPQWLQHFCNVLPLTLFVNGLRKISFEDVHMWQMPATIIGLILWIALVVPISVKSFKWE